MPSTPIAFPLGIRLMARSMRDSKFGVTEKGEGEGAVTCLLGEVTNLVKAAGFSCLPERDMASSRCLDRRRSAEIATDIRVGGRACSATRFCFSMRLFSLLIIAVMAALVLLYSRNAVGYFGFPIL